MFLKTKTVNIEFGQTYSVAFEKRQKADYDDYVNFTHEEVSNDFANAVKFIEQVKKMIQEN